MPEFILELGTRDAATRYHALDAFTQGYIEAMFFTECHSGNPELEHATVHDLAPETWDKILADCKAWQEASAALLAAAYERDDYSSEQAGRDYWFNRNGHGVGFWDRDQLKAEGLGEKLSQACGRSTRDVYRGDDGLIYLT